MGMGHKAESVSVGCKVLPICDLATLGDADCSRSLEKEGLQQQQAHKRRKAVSRLLRWAAAAKSTKAAGIKGLKVLYLRNKMDSLDDVDACARSSSSSKMSFRWDVHDNCSISSSAAVLSRRMSMPLPPAASTSDHQMWSTSNLSNRAATLRTANSDASSLGSPTKSKSEYCSRAAQWITTDSDFVVLEL